MFNETIYSNLISIVPYWSNNLVLISGLGPEYNMISNLLLTEILKMFTKVIDKNSFIGIFIILVIILISKKYFYIFNFNLWEKYSIYICGIESYNSNGITIQYCDKILAINHYLINNKNYKNITFMNNIDISINNINNYKLEDNIFLTINRNNINGDNNSKIVNYLIWSYNDNIDKFIDKLIFNYKNININKLVLIGDESNNQLLYPLSIIALNHYILNNYSYPNIKCTLKNNIDIKDNEKKNIDKTKLTEYLYTLGEIDNYEIDNIKLSITRNSNKVYYYIISNNISCKNWLDNVIENYNQYNDEFKYQIKLTGTEFINRYKRVHLLMEMCVLSWYLINRLNYTNYEICINTLDLNKIEVLLNTKLFKINKDIYISVSRNEPDNEGNNNINYILYSNKPCIEEFINNIIEEYNKINIGKILYHFKYRGINEKSDSLLFETNILVDKNNNIEIFESFDKIYNEHSSILKNDIDKLKDIYYHKKFGLKRKKGYLFYGEPGCGKTSSVIAMALYDNRHIIEISLSSIKSQDEFNRIMNLKKINNIPINKNQIIILFDEIDYGFDNYEKNDENPLLELITNSKRKDNNEKINSTPLNIGSILSCFDGIGNYNGLIIVATTNNIDKIHPSLYRDLRLTPIEFKKLRKIDCINIIESYFGKINNYQLTNIINDYVISPTKLINLCQNNEHLNINDFFNTILINYL